MTSRSFGKKVTALAELEEAVGYYTATACQKMRKQMSLANGIYVFLQTEHTHHTSYYFTTTTNDTPAIMQLAKECLRKLYKPGMKYKKAGIMLLDLIPETMRQYELFADLTESKNGLVMKAMDSINERLGKNTVFYCGEGIQKQWKIRCERRSPRYTTRWDELVTAK
jgi:DNA polymerase V